MACYHFLIIRYFKVFMGFFSLLFLFFSFIILKYVFLVLIQKPITHFSLTWYTPSFIKSF